MRNQGFDKWNPTKETLNETLKKPERNPFELSDILIRNPDKNPYMKPYETVKKSQMKF